MSKSLGNSPDPLTLIEKFGADGVRVGMLLTSPAGNDLPFDDSLCEQGRNFSNKIWNALRLVKGWEVDETLPQPEYAGIATQWFHARMSSAMALIEENFEKYRLSDALMAAYKLVWDDFCSWYLEMIKPAYQQPIDRATLDVTIGFFEKLMQVLHPFMPFITEEIWHLLAERSDTGTIMLSQMPVAEPLDNDILITFEHASAAIMGIRNIRKDKNIPFKNQVELIILGENPASGMDAIVSKLGNISGIKYMDEKPGASAGFRVKSTEYFIPLGEGVDLEAEREKLQKELEYLQGFLISVEKKLGNEKFMSNAKPEIVESEQQKKADALEKIDILNKSIAAL